MKIKPKMEHKFIPLPELIRIPHLPGAQSARKLLSTEQRKILSAHKVAQKDWFFFCRNGFSRQIHPVGIPFEVRDVKARAWEISPFNSAKKALFQALRYYGNHNMLHRTDEILAVAERHWHPVIAEDWQLHVAEQLRIAVRQHKIKVPEELISKLLGTTQRAVFRRRIEAAERREDARLALEAAKTTRRSGKGSN
ncbi:MAG: hypothetical protein Q8R15_02345 [Candidatus Micrarchaeota archaeon]|nr:hypothetical protein [Candidatus Micrarchaeota archaeon]